MRFKGTPCWFMNRRTASARSSPSRELIASASPRIRVALDLHINIAVVVLQLVREVRQTLLGFRRELGAVRRKLHRIVRQDHGVEEFALCQLAGGRGAVERVLGRLVELAQMGLVLVQAGSGWPVPWRLQPPPVGSHNLGRAAAKTEGACDDGCGGEDGGSYALHRCSLLSPPTTIQPASYSVAEIGCFCA